MVVLVRTADARVKYARTYMSPSYVQQIKVGEARRDQRDELNERGDEQGVRVSVRDASNETCKTETGAS